MSLFAWATLNVSLTLTWKFHIQAMPLEIYHLPPQVRGFIRTVLLPNLRSQLSDAALRPKARLRAAELRRMMCLGLDDESTLWLAGGEAVSV